MIRTKTVIKEVTALTTKVKVETDIQCRDEYFVIELQSLLKACVEYNRDETILALELFLKEAIDD